MPRQSNLWTKEQGLRPWARYPVERLAERRHRLSGYEVLFDLS